MKCEDCGADGHKAGWPYCPGKIMRKTEPKHAPVTKKPWVKPTLTRWVKADSVDTVVDTPKNVNVVVDKKESRRKAQREWVKKKRAKECLTSA